MDPAQIEQTNRLRISLGLKPLPVPGASGPQFKEKPVVQDGEEPASTLETREAAAYDNYKSVQDEEAAKKKRAEKLAAIKKARDAAKRFETLQGKGLGDAEEDGDVSAKSWLKGQNKRQKKIDKARKYDEEVAKAEAEALAAIQYTSKDLAGVNVGHQVDDFDDGDEHIMTLKDTNILNEEDGDELENAELRDREKLTEKLELKKKKPVYDPHAANDDGAEQSLLGQYDEEIYGKKGKSFVLDSQGTTESVKRTRADDPMELGQKQKISLDFLEDDKPSSDYLDISEVKVKKPKKKKSKSTRQRPVDDDDIFPAAESTQPDQSMDIDSGEGLVSKKRKSEDTTFADDEDLQATLATQRRTALKKRKRARPEDIAKQLREEATTQEMDDAPENGLVLDETTEFVSGIKKEDVEERKSKPKPRPAEAVTAMEEDDSDGEDQPMKDESLDHQNQQELDTIAEEANEAQAIGVDEEKTIGSGVGAALKLLRDRQLLGGGSNGNGEDGGGGDAGDLNDQFRRKEAFNFTKRRKMEQIEQDIRNQRERDRNSGRLDRMTTREREEWARQQNTVRDQQASRQLADLFNREYKPTVNLKYHDEHGRSLDRKEAFKHLSHQFHGKGSGKGKTDKRLKKIEDEQRREAQSMLDASQNVGMSSAAQQQTKKRKEAGVRLA